MLTPRQREVLRLLAYGLTLREVADRLGVSLWTVKSHHRAALRTLRKVFTSESSSRMRTTLACYVLGLLDAGMPPAEVTRRVRDIVGSGAALGRTGDDEASTPSEDSVGKRVKLVRRMTRNS